MRRVSLGLSVFNIVSRVNGCLYFLLHTLGFVLRCGGNDGMEGCCISLYTYIHTCDLLRHSLFFCPLPSIFFAKNYLTVVGGISFLGFFFQTFRCLFFISMYMCVSGCL